jgi:hypothetical protein
MEGVEEKGLEMVKVLEMEMEMDNYEVFFKKLDKISYSGNH